MEKKKRILEMELEGARNMGRIDICSTIIQNHIVDHFKSIYNLLESQQELCLLVARENNTQIENADSSLIDILEYKKGELVKLGINLFPYNAFKLESYFTHHKVKERIKYAIKSKLYELKDFDADGRILDIWNKALLFFEISKEGRNADFDNYFMKPYVDGIVLSRFVSDDKSNNLKIFYSPLKKRKYLIELTLINQNFIKNYQDFLLDFLIS